MTITKCQTGEDLCIRIMAGLDIDKNAVQRIESGKRFVTDIELKVIAKVLGVSYRELLDS